MQERKRSTEFYILLCCVVVIILVLAVPIVVNFVMVTPGAYAYSGNSPWLSPLLSYWGAILGGTIAGGLTFGGVWATLYYQGYKDFIKTYQYRINIIKTNMMSLDLSRQMIIISSEDINQAKADFKWWIDDCLRIGGRLAPQNIAYLDGELYAILYTAAYRIGSCSTHGSQILDDIFMKLKYYPEVYGDDEVLKEIEAVIFEYDTMVSDLNESLKCHMNALMNQKEKYERSLLIKTLRK